MSSSKKGVKGPKAGYFGSIAGIPEIHADDSAMFIDSISNFSDEPSSYETDTTERLGSPPLGQTLLHGFCECPSPTSTGCNTHSCECFKSRGPCGGFCACKDCCNIFNIEKKFFEDEDMRYTPCFVDWVRRRKYKVDLQDPELRERLRCKLFNIHPRTGTIKPLPPLPSEALWKPEYILASRPLLREALWSPPKNSVPLPPLFNSDMQGDPGANKPLFSSETLDEEVMMLAQRWLEPEVERTEILRKLFRAGLGQGENAHYFSFCKGKNGVWVDKNEVEHCSACRSCVKPGHLCWGEACQKKNLKMKSQG
ncbi:hypothetical protein BU16DRAFT_559555 [Lophium mytilinum]|uniref:Tesmin/TSO1-like CXC domain-containing protein n=1 Tax=Lophium mytilinum TaxID=390894 RepID=A0A6A6QZX3_9PEZI|nr:hypothetical protein BU16DRAFT_559555 [Lophium mytilinum]